MTSYVWQPRVKGGHQPLSPVGNRCGAATRAYRSSPPPTLSEFRISPQRAPEAAGEHFARDLDINDPDADAKSADSSFGWAQGLRVTMNPACWGKSASKFCTAGSGSGSPQPQHRSEYRSLAVMRNAQTA